MSNRNQQIRNGNSKPEERYAFFETEVVEPATQHNNGYGPPAPGNYNNYPTSAPAVNYNNPAYNNNVPPNYPTGHFNSYRPAPGPGGWQPPPRSPESQNLTLMPQPYTPSPQSPLRPTGTTPPPQYQPPSPQYQAPVPPVLQQPPYNPTYSSAAYPTNSHLTQPYTRPTMLSQQQAPYTSPPIPPIVGNHGASQSHSRYNTTSSSSTSPLTSSRRPPPPIAAEPIYGSKFEGRQRHYRDEDDCGDCCSICGCFRCACTLVMIILGILFILGGLTLFAFSNTLPAKCTGPCDLNLNNGTFVNGTSVSSQPLINNATTSLNNTTNGLSQQCSNLCSKGVYDGLHYSGVALLIIGGIIIGCQVLNMFCRVGRNGGRGSGCCYCC